MSFLRLAFLKKKYHEQIFNFFKSIMIDNVLLKMRFFNSLKVEQKIVKNSPIFTN